MDMPIDQLDEYRWRIPPRGKMRVPGVIYASESMIRAFHGVFATGLAG